MKTVPLRPRFTGDVKNVPWTDSCSDQEGFRKAVRKWLPFYNNSSDTSSNKIARVNQGVLLQSHFFGRARNIRKSIDNDVINSKHVVDAIVGIFHECDSLTVSFKIYSEVIQLMFSKRGSCKSF